VGSCQSVGAQAAFAPKESISFLMHPRLYAQMQVPSSSQFSCLDKLWKQESHWNPKALNKSSGAYGIAQFLPTTWGNYKVHKTANSILQVDYGLRYISARYGTPCAAWKHEKRFGWY